MKKRFTENPTTHLVVTEAMKVIRRRFGMFRGFVSNRDKIENEYMYSLQDYGWEIASAKIYEMDLQDVLTDDEVIEIQDEILKRVNKIDDKDEKQFEEMIKGIEL